MLICSLCEKVREGNKIREDAPEQNEKTENKKV